MLEVTHLARGTSGTPALVLINCFLSRLPGVLGCHITFILPETLWEAGLNHLVFLWGPWDIQWNQDSNPGTHCPLGSTCCNADTWHTHSHPLAIPHRHNVHPSHSGGLCPVLSQARPGPCTPTTILSSPSSQHQGD